MYVSRGSIIYVMTALTFVAYIQVNSCCSYVFQCERINLYVAFSDAMNQQAHDCCTGWERYLCLQLVTLNTFTSHVGATEYQDCFIESTIYQLRHFLLLILLCRHASNRELF